MEYLPNLNFIRGGETTYPEAETTLAEIIARWPGPKDSAWTNEIAGLWQVLAVQHRDRKAEATSLRCFQHAVAWSDSEYIWSGYFLSAVANQSGGDICKAAPFQLRRSNDDLLNDSPILLTTVGEVLAGPYGLPRDEARLKAIAQLLTENTGGVPDALAAYATPTPIPPAGTPAWESLIRTQIRRFNGQQQPPHSAKFGWELASHALDLPATNSTDALLLPYQMLFRLAEDYHHADATAVLDRVEKSGSPEQRARRACGNYWAVEPFNGADLFVAKAKAGEVWAIRALELWILWDKLPKDAIEANYLKEFPSVKTVAVEQWLREN